MPRECAEHRIRCKHVSNITTFYKRTLGGQSQFRLVIGINDLAGLLQNLLFHSYAFSDSVHLFQHMFTLCFVTRSPLFIWFAFSFNVRADREQMLCLSCPPAIGAGAEPTLPGLALPSGMRRGRAGHRQPASCPDFPEEHLFSRNKVDAP